jgi:type II secretory pathway pseudopilin PulG
MQLPIFNYQFSIRDNESGQSLFELVVAIGISALIIVTVVSLTSNALQNAAFAKNESLAGTYAQQATEWLRGQRDADTDTFEANVENGGLNAERCFNDSLDDPDVWSDSIGRCGANDTISDSSGNPTPFVRQITFTQIGTNPYIIEADVTVSWTDSKGMHEVTNATDFSDWRQR